MRPQQQNRRMRGRNNNGGGNNNNNNRKGPNPLTRNYESNGPDVKIRGSAQQIAEKYATLARDAQSSGDRVMAENYLQHAEHYNRIIAAAQAQLPIQSAQQNRDDFDDDGDEDRDEFDNAGNSNVGETAAPVVNHGGGPQPVIDGTPAELAFNQENGRDNRDTGGRDTGGRDNSGRDNGGRHRDRRPNGGYGQNGGQRGEFGARGEHGGQRDDQNRRGDQSRRNETPVQNETPIQAETVSPVEPVSVAEPAPQFESFSPAALAAQAEMNEAAAESGAARRPRRPRRPRVNADQVDGGNDNAGADNVNAAPAEDAGGEPAIIDVNN
ncbi:MULTISPECIES: DUF4167 domain-containing protein [unclassified Mesorhizobium]|uniref:DUF4167 domain-containing protein n=2 Tax=Mesorhizobium TaxID=68287 RepID=UPI000FC99676|nr:MULTISPECIES: DUF4167 domain-containing protein [unclassified Mesorhizobium]RUV91583.1 DUF4167 domain-containing protein [Mesorhizobium sp. M5C.F.Ca.IN.020.14.1.1]RUV61778.1 DUF4167 domain-containing protein [Mesorhizobium sp. M5C.F.Ca.IN.020.29.1.1]RWH47850.1 MAG: DUF4167 domain-containing protein [Mesorhizobium sp.]RWH50469.1 MAG: DUF4167 domain-containing protein [Mesorhizobium sp.]RWI65598.1 MAG: DUF4167 domain-containing protein [Mesorhizobium sp.]